MRGVCVRLLCAVLPGITLTGLTDCTAFLGCRQPALPADTALQEAFSVLHPSGPYVPDGEPLGLAVMEIVESHTNEAVIPESLADVGLYRAGHLEFC